MDPFEMVVAIVLIVTIGGVISRSLHHKAQVLKTKEGAGSALQGKEVNKRLIMLEERVVVLERLATDKSKRLRDEIDAL